MGCSNSSSADELDTNKRPEKDSSNEKKSNNKDNSDKNENNESDKEKKSEKEKENEIKKDSKKDAYGLNTEENKSNLMTEGVTSEARKINLHKQNYEGVVLMKGIEESIPEDLNEDDIYQLVEEALNYKISDENSDPKKKVTKPQTKAIASILYNKIKNKTDKINIKDYPELKGMNIKIGAEKLTKDIIRNMMFLNKKVDECQIDLTYANLTRENDDIKALTIEIN